MAKRTNRRTNENVLQRESGFKKSDHELSGQALTEVGTEVEGHKRLASQILNTRLSAVRIQANNASSLSSK